MGSCSENDLRKNESEQFHSPLKLIKKNIKHPSETYTMIARWSRDRKVNRKKMKGKNKIEKKIILGMNLKYLYTKRNFATEVFETNIKVQ